MRTYPVTYQHRTPTTSTHRPPSTALAQHTRAPQAPHTLPPACARHQPPSPHAAVRPQVPPTTSHRMSPLRSPAATTDSPALQPRPLGLPGSRAPPHPLPPLRGPQPPPPRTARGPGRTPPASHPSFFGYLTDTLRDQLGGYYVADAADHAWAIAVAAGNTPLPPHSPPLRHSGGGLNVAARHILLALYLHHRNLHLPDPQLPAPQAAALTPEAWADTAPEEIAAYLRTTCRRFTNALGRRKGTPYPLSAWQVTPSWTVYRLACHRLLPWLRVTFAMVPDAAWPGSGQWLWSTAPATGPVGRLGRPSASDPWGIGSFLSLGRPTCVQSPGPLGSCSPVCPRGLLWCVCGVLGQLAPVHRCARSVCCVACAVSWAPGLLFTGVRAVCGACVPWVVVSLFLPP